MGVGNVIASKISGVTIIPHGYKIVIANCCSHTFATDGTVSTKSVDQRFVSILGPRAIPKADISCRTLALGLWTQTLKHRTHRPSLHEPGAVAWASHLSCRGGRRGPES